MAKYFLVLVIMISLSLPVFAAGTDTGSKTGKSDSKFENRSDQLKDLQNKRRMVAMKIYQLRVKLISEDSDMLMLHNQIMKLHKQLAIELNSNEEMKPLLDEAADIDKQMEELIKAPQSAQQQDK